MRQLVILLEAEKVHKNLLSQNKKGHVLIIGKRHSKKARSWLYVTYTREELVSFDTASKGLAIVYGGLFQLELVFFSSL